MKDAIEYFRAVLVSKTAITSLVSTRVYGELLPKGYTLPAIRIEGDGGGWTSTEAPIQERSIAVECWAATPTAAKTLWKAVYDALSAFPEHSATVGGVTEILTVYLDGGEEIGQQDETTQFYCFGTYIIGMAI